MDLHFKKERKLDIQNVSNFFGELASFLSAVCTMMSSQNEYLIEMEAEYRAEMQANYSHYDYL